MVKQRIEYIDNAKGLLILSVVIGHIFTNGPVHDFIYTFHMPAFFIISGILLNYSQSLNASFAQFLWSKILRIFLPFCFIEAIGIVTDILNGGSNQSLAGYAYNLVHLQFNNGMNWFMFCFFISEILFYLVHRLSANNHIKGFASFLAFIIGVILPPNHYYAKLFGESLIAFSFLIIGYSFFTFFQRNNRVAFITAILVVTVVTFINGPIELSAKTINNPLLFLVGSISGTYFIVHLGEKLNYSILSYLGQNTIAIFATHRILIIFLKKALPFPNSRLTLLLILVIVLFLECPILYLLNSYAPILVGKKRQ